MWNSNQTGSFGTCCTAAVVSMGFSSAVVALSDSQVNHNSIASYISELEINSYSARENGWSNVLSIEPKENGLDGPLTVSISEKIVQLKTVLGLPNKDIAELLGVTRQSLYNYLKGADETRVNEPTLKRLNEMYEASKLLSELLPRSPGAMAKNYTVDGFSLYQRLLQEELDFDSIKDLTSSLAEKMKANLAGNNFNEQTLRELTKSL